MGYYDAFECLICGHTEQEIHDGNADFCIECDEGHQICASHLDHNIEDDDYWFGYGVIKSEDCPICQKLQH